MPPHWSTPYIGQPYIRGEADCARLVCRVRAEVFGLPVPNDADVERAASRLGRVAQLSDGLDEYCSPTTQPQEGDVVQMIALGRPSHVGSYCVVDGEPSVLHALENAGMVVRHRLRDLEHYALKLEGFYRWK